MQAAIRTIPAVRRNPQKGAREKKYSQRCKAVQKSASTLSRAGGNFLKKEFQPIRAVDIFHWSNSENYKNLYRAAKNYSALLGSSFALEYDGSFTALYGYLNDKIKLHDQQLSIVNDDNILSFSVRYQRDYLSQILYFIPCKILSITEEDLTEILVRLFRQFSSQGIPSMYEEWDVEMLITDWLDTVDQDDIDEDYYNLAKRYQSGDVRDVFKYIYSQESNLEELEKMTIAYKVQNEQEAGIIDLVTKGIEIFKLNKVIMNYVRDGKEDLTEEEREDFDYGISADRMMRVVYDLEDHISEAMIEMIDNEGQEGYSDYIPASSLTLTKDTDKLLTHGYPEIFCTWLGELIYKLNCYE